MQRATSTFCPTDRSVAASSWATARAWARASNRGADSRQLRPRAKDTRGSAFPRTCGTMRARFARHRLPRAGARRVQVARCRSAKRPRVGRAHQRGVLFSTFSTLVSSGQSRTATGTSQARAGVGRGAGTGTATITRLEQLCEWLGSPAFEGVLCFDEAHRAKHFVPGKEDSTLTTKVARSVIELQRRLPRAQVVYASATGISDVGSMAFAERLGLWGQETISFFDRFTGRWLLPARHGSAGDACL